MICLDGMCQECAWDDEIVPSAGSFETAEGDTIALCETCRSLYETDGLLAALKSEGAETR